MLKGTNAIRLNMPNIFNGFSGFSTRKMGVSGQVHRGHLWRVRGCPAREVCVTRLDSTSHVFKAFIQLNLTQLALFYVGALQCAIHADNTFRLW